MIWRLRQESRRRQRRGQPVHRLEVPRRHRQQQDVPPRERADDAPAREREQLVDLRDRGVWLQHHQDPPNVPLNAAVFDEVLGVSSRKPGRGDVLRRKIVSGPETSTSPSPTGSHQGLRACRHAPPRQASVVQSTPSSQSSSLSQQVIPPPGLIGT